MEIKEFIGMVFTKVYEVHGEEIHFVREDGKEFIMYHDQDCCESVNIEDINGDLDDLIGSEILVAEEKTNDKPARGESCTWTFYTLATKRGYVDIRWLGMSNGYYSERVSIREK